MEVILASIFSGIIIGITVHSILKLLIIAYKKNDISLRKFIIFTTSSIVIGLIVASLLPFGNQKIMDYIY